MAEDGGEGGELRFTTGVYDREVFDGGDDVDGHGVRDLIQSRHARAEVQSCRSLEIVGDLVQGKSHSRVQEVLFIISIPFGGHYIDSGRTIDIYNR